MIPGMISLSSTMTFGINDLNKKQINKWSSIKMRGERPNQIIENATENEKKIKLN